MAKAKTKKYSMKGWKLKEFVMGRKRLLFTFVGSLGAWLVTQNPGLSALVGAATELLGSVVEYWLKQ